MKRRLFNLLAAVSLVVCVAIIVLWARSWRSRIWTPTSAPNPKLSYFMTDDLSIRGEDRYYVSSSAGRIHVGHGQRSTMHPGWLNHGQQKRLPYAPSLRIDVQRGVPSAFYFAPSGQKPLPWFGIHQFDYGFEASTLSTSGYAASVTSTSLISWLWLR